MSEKAARIERAFLNFLEVRCVQDAGAKESCRALFNAWSLFLQDYGLEPETMWAFGRRLTLRGFGSKTIRDVAGRTGLALKKGHAIRPATDLEQQGKKPANVSGFEIEKDIPVPGAIGVIKRIQNVMRLMEEGDSVFFPGVSMREHSRITNARGAFPKIHFSIKQSSKNGVDGYRVFHTGRKA